MVVDFLSSLDELLNIPYYRLCKGIPKLGHMLDKLLCTINQGFPEYFHIKCRGRNVI